MERVETQLEYIFIIIWHYIHVAHYCDKKAFHKNIIHIVLIRYNYNMIANVTHNLCNQ